MCVRYSRHFYTRSIVLTICDLFFSYQLASEHKWVQCKRLLCFYDAARNRYLDRTLADLHDTLMLLNSTTFTVPGRAEKAVDEHRRMVEAIERRNADAAEQRAREHIRNSQDARFAMRPRPS